jgi:hypothetical protein
METDGGGWLQVRHVSDSGNWGPDTDHLAGTSINNPNLSASLNASTNWSVEFDFYLGGGTQYLFSTGDKSAWCVIGRGPDGNFFGTTGPGVMDNLAMQTPVIASFGTTIASGGMTNVVYRLTATEDPWVGCEGTHPQNIQKMLYGEAGYAGYYEFKNAHHGINVFIR